MKKSQETKYKNGITLIALAITVVVLIILAGVSINAVVGDDGIIKKAQESANLTKECEAKEIINRAVLEFRLTEEYDTLEDFLKTKVSNGTIDSVINNGDGTLTISKNGYTLIVENKKGNSSKDDSSGNIGEEKISLSATPYIGTYDGKVHNALTKVTVVPTDAKIEYSTDETNYSTTMPTITNASSLAVSVRASKSGYKTQSIIQTAKVNKANGSLSLSSYSGTIDYHNSISFTASGTGSICVQSSNIGVATVSVSESTVTVKSVGVGSATITVTSAATTNYNAQSATYAVTVNGPTFTEDSGVGYYADTDGDGIPDGIIFADKKTGGSGSWGGTDYTISTATGLKEYYVSKINYNGPFGTKDVLSARGSGNARFNVMALSDYNNSATYTHTNAKSITSGDWRVPTKNELVAFGGELGITTSNYSGYGLKDTYWSSTNDGFGTFGIGYYASFSTGAISSRRRFRRVLCASD